MNPHKLIFDYLDGEITREDDKALRELLKEDTELSRDFRSILDISYEINKSNEEFIYPETFLDNFEESIISRMEADNSARKEKERKRRLAFGYSIAAVPAFIVLLILTTFNFGNLQIDLNKSGQSSSNNKNISGINQTDLNNGINQVDLNESSIQTVNSKSVLNKNIKSNNKRNILAKQVTTVNNTNNNLPNISNSSTDADFKSSANVSDDENNTIEAKESVRDIPYISKNPIPDSDLSNSNVSVNNGRNSTNSFDKSTNVQLSISSPIQNIDNSFDNSEMPDSFEGFNTEFASFSSKISGSNVELNSFFGKEFATFGVSGVKDLVSSFTQSIAARVDEYTKIGLETGYMQFSGNESKYTIIKNGNSNSFTILDNSDEKGELFRIPGTQATDRRLFWAGIFYERNLLELNKLALSSRMSFGASDIGFVSSLKMIGRYQLLKQVDLTIGADAKLFSGTKEYFVCKNSLGSTISFIYGIRFAF